MGPAIETTGKIVSFVGVKGGVGCSVLSSLIGRVAAKKSTKKIAMIDATPFPYSLVPSYLSIPSPNHYLIQLQPYQDQLTSKMVENFFSTTPEGVTYIPLRNTDESSTSFAEIFPLVQKLTQWFDYLFLDL